MAKVPVVRATLIQDTAEFQEVIRPHLQPLVDQRVYDGADYQKALLWVIAEELEIIHGLFDSEHQFERRREPYHSIYCQLRNATPDELSRYVGYYIAAPRIYHDHNTVDITLHWRDLYIQYYRYPYQREEIGTYPFVRR